MFRWYRNADKCYAYLSDVKEIAQLERSRWFTRGWTLQELVAPKTVHFYNSDWEHLGSKRDLQVELQRLTGIDAEVLIAGDLDTVSTARRMSWAAKRQTTRPEDLAYSLMGIFGVNMPLLYGEGKKSFARLQEEILKTSADQSLFAWGLQSKVATVTEFLRGFHAPSTSEMYGLLADSPSEFTFVDRIHVLEDTQFTLPPIVSYSGVRIELQVQRLRKQEIQFAVLYCTLKDNFKYYLGIPIVPWGERWVARFGEPVLIAVADFVTANSKVPFCNPSVLFVKAPPLTSKAAKTTDTLALVQVPSTYNEHYLLGRVETSKYTDYSAKDQTITIPEDKDALHAVFYFAPSKSDPLQLFPPLDYDRLKSQHGTSLVAHRQTDSFITTATGWGLGKHDNFSIVYPPFAILVGGRRKDPWTKSVIVLSDDDAEGDFRRLHAMKGNLVRACATMNHLLSLLEQHQPPSGHHQRHERLTVAAWSYSYLYREDAMWKHSKGEERLSVDTRLQMVTRNLVERSLVLFVELTRADEPERDIDRQPRWWAFQEND